MKAIKQRRVYTAEFKEQAVALVNNSDKTLKAIAEDLGIDANMLSRWRQVIAKRQNGQRAFPGHGQSRDEELASVVKELRQTKLEVEILKKAMGYFASQPQ